MAQQFHRESDNPRERQTSPPSRAGSTRRSAGMQGESPQQGAEAGHLGNEGLANLMSPPVIAMRGIGQIYDMQMAAARLLLQAQASAASAFGWPDYSGFFQVADERVRRAFSAGAEQFLHLAEQATEATTEVQRQVSRMLESQAVNLAENWQRGLEEIGSQAEKGLEELRELARLQTEEAMRAAESVSAEGREAIREGGEQLRQSLRQGMEPGREPAVQAGEAVREQAEQGSRAMHAAAEAAGSEKEAPSRQPQGQPPEQPSPPTPKRKAS